MWQSRIEIADYSDLAKNYCKAVFHLSSISVLHAISFEQDQKFAVLLF